MASYMLWEENYTRERLTPRRSRSCIKMGQLPLQRWTARLGYLLNVPGDKAAGVLPATSWSTPTAYQWLGLHLLTALEQIIPFYPPPHAELEGISAHVSPEEQAQMGALTEWLIIGLQSAIRGRDAFSRPQSCPTKNGSRPSRLLWSRAGH